MIKLLYPLKNTLVLKTDSKKANLFPNYEPSKIYSYDNINTDMPFCTGAYWRYIFILNKREEFSI